MLISFKDIRYGGAMVKAKIISVVLMLLFTLSLVSSLQAAVAPEVIKLSAINNVSFPAVTADSSGKIYVLDGVNRVLKIYNSMGLVAGSLKFNFKPTTIAVSDGYIYVGGKGRIDLYHGSTFINSFKIAELPASIALLNGKVYVADGYFIKVFDSGMNKIFEFGGYAGYDGVQRNGKFNDISSIAVDYKNSQLYVLDRGAITTVNGYGTTYVWRVQVFDENGNFIRSFSNYGFDKEGQIGSASSIAIDSESRIYVADNVQNIIAVYDSYGTYLKTIYSLNDPVYNPVSIFFKNDRLYVASNMARSIYTFGIDQYALLRIEPRKLDFTSQSDPVSGSLSIFNDGAKDLYFTASTQTPWISLSETSGLIPPGASTLLGISVNPSGLPAGIYRGSVEINSNGGSEIILVTLNVIGPPELSVSPSSFDIIKKKGAPSDPLIVNISLLNDLSGAMAWKAESDSIWLTITPGSGPSNSTISANIIVNTNLDPGKYKGTITVTAPGADGSPATITVNLEIRANRKISINSNIESASFTVTGPVSFEGSGTNYVVEDVPPGTYKVTFKPVKGYRTPEPQTGTLPIEGEVLFTGEYQSLGDRLNIIASHGPGQKDNMEIRVFNGDGELIKTVAPVKPYNRGATTSAGDINGDGIYELIIGTGPGAKIPPVVTVIGSEGGLIGEFRPFSGSGYGVEVLAQDLDRDGSAEIITAKTRKFAGTPAVDLKVYKYINGQFVNKGISLRHRGANGIRIASADLNGDEIPEVLVIPARGHAPVYVYNIDTSQELWTASLVDTYSGCEGSGGSNIATGDTDGDGVQEIILSCHYYSGTVIRILDAEGNKIKEFSTGSALKDYVSAGDLDGDGMAEIIVGDGPAAQKKTVKIFNPEGGLIRSFDAFENSFGVRISTGRF